MEIGPMRTVTNRSIGQQCSEIIRLKSCFKIQEDLEEKVEKLHVLNLWLHWWVDKEL